MAKGAVGLLVWALLGEVSHLVVIEFRCFLFRTVTLGAILPKFAFVFVILLVAIEATVLLDFVLVLFMTFAAWKCQVLALEFELLMFETKRLWRIETEERRVALRAIIAEEPSMLVLVAIDTIELVRAVNA